MAVLVIDGVIDGVIDAEFDDRTILAGTVTAGVPASAVRGATDGIGSA